MVKWVGRSMVALMAVFTVLIALIPAVFPSSAPLALMQDAACRFPCVFGIHLGDSGFARVLEHLRAQGLMNNRSVIIQDAGVYFETEAFTGELRFQADQVTHIAINGQIPLETLIVMFGLPDCVEVSGIGSIVLNWVRSDVTVGAILIDPLPYIAVDVVDYLEFQPTFDGNYCELALMQPWRGFAPLWFYESKRGDVAP